MKTWDHLCVDLLPKLLQEFVRLIGLPATMTLVDKLGGLRIYIPANPRADHQLAQLIGLENLRQLSKVYGNESHFELPKAERALTAVRNAKMRAEYGPKSLRMLAAEHHLTERQVTRIVGANQANERQESLFE